MKILFLSENFPPESNAAATRVYERACYWAEWGHQVTVITSVPNFPEGKLFAGFENKWKQVETMSGIRVVRVKTYIAANRGVAHRTLDFLSFMATGFLAALKEQRPDVIAATSPQFFTAVAGWAASATRGVPFVFELGDLWPASISAVGAMKKSFALGLVEKLELFLYRRSAAIAALTGSFKDNLVSRGIDADKISVVINGVDLSRYAPRPQDTALADEWGFKGKFVAGYIGTHGMAHALGNVLDAAERLKDNPGQLIADRHADVSIMFADVAGFTALSANQDPAETVNLLNTLFSEFDDVCDAAGIEKIRTIGDGYMVVGGVPKPLADHPVKMIEAAKKILDIACRHNIDIRIGINSGEVVAGIVGVRRFHYDVWGDAVNIAARMETTGKVGKIHVSSGFAERLGDKYPLKKRDPINIKGKGTMQTWFVEVGAG